MHASRHRRSGVRLARTRALAASTLLTTAAVVAGAVVDVPTASATLPPSASAGASTGLMSAPSFGRPELTASRRGHHKRVHKVKVHRVLFGVHDRYLTSLHHHSTGSLRLWDAGTDWPEIQPTATTPVADWNWAPLDQAVRAAHANGTQVTLVLGLSPAYAAATPTDPPNLAKYKAYLTAVMRRYSPAHWGYRGIAAYQVWNEVNIKTFWTGTVAQAVALTKAAYDVRNHVDKGAQLVAPAMVARLKFEQKWIRAFYRSTVPSTHRRIWKYVDAISLNLYPLQTIALRHGRSRVSTPEDAMALLQQVRGILARAKVPSSKPIWDTEINYGMGAGVAAAKLSTARQVANVIRTYVLNAARGVQRVDWYAYDMGELPGGGTLGDTLLTDPGDRQAGKLTAAGVAFTRVEKWLTGTLVGTRTRQPCITDRHGTYTCTVKYRHGFGRIYWNPFHSAKVRLVPSAHTRTDEYGRTHRAKGGSRLKVGFRPVLVKSRK